MRTFLSGTVVLDRGGFGDPTTFFCHCGTPQPFRTIAGGCICPKCCGGEASDGHRFGPHLAGNDDLDDDQCVYCGVRKGDIKVNAP